MNAKSKGIKSDLKKAETHSIKKDEYEELQELTDEMFDRAVYKVDGIIINKPTSPQMVMAL